MARALVGALVLALTVGVGPGLATATATATPKHQPQPQPKKPKKPKKPKIDYGPPVTVTLTSANLSSALSPQPSLRFSSVVGPQPMIRIRDAVSYQRFKGAGGALTDTSAWLMQDQLRPGTRAWLMRKLFSPTGIGLNLIRTPIGASDFTATGQPYSYDDVAPGQTDPALAHFTIRRDLAYVLPVLRQAVATASHPFVFANPWSPPGWMKSNDSLSNRGDSGRLLASSYAPLAQYFVRYLTAYAQQGVKVSAISAQNEPGQQSSYPGLNETLGQEETFIASYLAPALRAAHLPTAIYGYDGPWGTENFELPLAHSRASGDLAGIATHCYTGVPAVMTMMHRSNPRLDELETECSGGVQPFAVSELEIASLRNWASGVMLWNLALDQHGGPVQPPDGGCLGCGGIVTVNTSSHQVSFGRDYYELGQLSKFVHAGAVRIDSTNFVSYANRTADNDIATLGLDDVAFRNRDGSHVLMAYNGARDPIPFGVEADGQYLTYTLDSGDTVTFTWGRWG